MDQYMVKFVSLLSDWQQTAINDTRYSVVLILLTALICGLIGFFYFKIKFTGLQRQLAQAHKDREQADKQRDELLSEQQRDAERIADNEQQLEQLSAQLQENEKSLFQQKQAEQRQSQVLAKKDAENSALQSQLNDKTELIEKQQLELEEQKNQLSKHLSDQKLIADIEKESGQFAKELNMVKQQLQQLETELNVKNEQIEEYAKLELSAGDSDKRVADLEAQLLAMNSSSDPEMTPEQLNTFENRLKQLEQEKQDAETKAERSAELENTIQLHKQQLLQLNEKLESFLSNPQSIKQEEIFVSDDENVSVNHGEISGKDLSHDEFSNEDVWLKHQMIISHLIDQFTLQAADTGQQAKTVETDNNSEAIAALKEQLNAQQNHIARLQYDLEIKKLLINEVNLDIEGIPASIIEKQQADQARIEALEQQLAIKKSNKVSLDFNEQIDDVTKTMDQFQEKLKGLYHKLIP